MSIKLTDKELMEIRFKLSGKKKPFQKTYKWQLAIGMNKKLVEPVLNGRGKVEPVVKHGGKRKRKKG